MKEHLIALTFFLIALTACSISTPIKQIAAPNVNVPNLSYINFGSNYECSLNWSRYSTDVPAPAIEVKSNFVENQWIAAGNSFDLKTCINNQADARCFLLYAMYNNRKDLCNYFPEQTVIQQFSPPSAGSGLGGGFYNQTCRYRELCIAFVEIFNSK